MKAPAKKENIYTVQSHNIYIKGVKRWRGDAISLTPSEAKEVLDGDKEAGRKPRIKK